MFYLHLHCSAVIAQRITAADVMGKNGFSQDGFNPLIFPWGMAQMQGLGLHFHHLICVLGFFCLSVCEEQETCLCFGFLFWMMRSQVCETKDCYRLNLNFKLNERSFSITGYPGGSVVIKCIL